MLAFLLSFNAMVSRDLSCRKQHFLDDRLLILPSSHQKGKKLCEGKGYSNLRRPQGAPLCRVPRRTGSSHTCETSSWPQGLLQGFTQNGGPSAQKEQTHTSCNFREYPKPRLGLSALKKNERLVYFKPRQMLYLDVHSNVTVAFYFTYSMFPMLKIIIWMGCICLTRDTVTIIFPLTFPPGQWLTVGAVYPRRHFGNVWGCFALPY